MNTPETQQPTNPETIETTELDAVTGGCAACGMPNCTMGANPAASANPAAKAAPFWAFNRR